MRNEAITHELLGFPFRIFYEEMLNSAIEAIGKPKANTDLLAPNHDFTPRIRSSAVSNFMEIWERH